MNIFDQMMTRYTIQTQDDYTNALHEVMQQIALAGLYRGGFFNKAAFYGGTCLRIFYGLERFSVDLDFSLLQPEPQFDLTTYFMAIKTEFKALGREVIISKKEKKSNSTIVSAFLKEDTAIYDLTFTTERSLKIKIEVDVNPPSGFLVEPKLLLMPFSFMATCYTTADLFAGKMHALLFRQWKNRVKGRDWYDFEWYVRHEIPLNFNHFYQRVHQEGNSKVAMNTPEHLKNLLLEKIRNTNIEQVKNDVRPFLRNTKEIDIWSTDYFLQLAAMIQFK